ncbi:MAG TPA: FtsX-like permease family protein, partial [Cyclobacteriaceae bacterium]
RSKDPGYDRHNVAVVFMPDNYPNEKIPVMKMELQRLPGVEAVSYSTFLIAGGGYYKDWYRAEVNGEMKPIQLNEVFFDHDFFDVMGVPLVAGRTFDINNPADAHGAFIINETAAKELGWSDPIGMRIAYGQREMEGEKWEGTVVGVMKDYNIYSMRRKIEPLVMRLPWSDWPGQCLYIKIKGPVNETLTSIRKRYEQVLPDFVAETHLIENLYDRQYDDEAKAFNVLQLATWIIVLISSLGIFSLSAYLSVTRMKEFGIRKVLGATIQQIAGLHVSYFLRIVLLSNIIALPVAYWVMSEWLDGFAYRTEFNTLIFLSVIGISFLLVIISAGYSAVKAGRMNPVDVIKG